MKKSISQLPPLICAIKAEDSSGSNPQSGKRFIPADRIPQVRPGYLSRATTRLTHRQDQLRVSKPADERMVQLNAEIDTLVNNVGMKDWNTLTNAQ